MNANAGRVQRLIFGLAMILCGFGVMVAKAAENAEADPHKGKTEYILAVSWQPGFCETRPGRKECTSQTAERFDATHFSLHGLWPLKKSYCGVAADMKARSQKGNWLDLPQLAVARETADRLLVAMPGTQSGLDRHQWLRSGTCHSGTAQDYFSLQLAFLDRLNASPVGALFSARLGGQVTEMEIKQAFDEGFGKGAGDRVRMRCQKDGSRSVVTGLTIGLSGKVAGGSDLATLIQAAAATDFKCAKGVVDAAGFQ